MISTLDDVPDDITWIPPDDDDDDEQEEKEDEEEVFCDDAFEDLFKFCDFSFLENSSFKKNK